MNVVKDGQKNPSYFFEEVQTKSSSFETRHYLCIFQERHL